MIAKKNTPYLYGGIAVVVLIALVAGGIIWLNAKYPATPALPGADSATGATQRSSRNDNTTSPANTTVVTPEENAASPDSVRPAPPELTEEEKAAAARFERETAALQSALDDDNTANILKEARALLQLHPNDSEIRQKAVEALAWTGWDGFSDIAGLLLDRDEAVAKAAQEAWALQISEAADANVKADMAKVAAESALDRDLEFFEEVMASMMDIPERKALEMLQDMLSRTQEPEFEELILGEIGFVTGEPVEKRGDVPNAIQEKLNQMAQDAADEAAAEAGV